MLRIVDRVTFQRGLAAVARRFGHGEILAKAVAGRFLQLVSALALSIENDASQDDLWDIKFGIVVNGILDFIPPVCPCLSARPFGVLSGRLPIVRFRFQLFSVALKVPKHTWISFYVDSATGKDHPKAIPFRQPAPNVLTA